MSRGHTVMSVSQTNPFWAVGREPGRELIALGSAVALTALGVDYALGGDIGLFYDLVFVTLCLALAALVRPGDFYVVALMPPALMVVMLGIVAAFAPEAIAGADDSFTQALVSGLVRHSPALLAGMAVSLGWLAQRLHAAGQDLP